MKLQKPPVVQTWIGLTFEAGEDTRAWNDRSAREFVGRFAATFPQSLATFETTYSMKHVPSQERMQAETQESRLQKLECYNDEGTHWLELGPGQLVCNRTRRKGDGVSFEGMLAETLGYLSDYVSFFRPRNLSSAALHYVDVVEIPIPSEKSVDLGEYFSFRVEFPEGFGRTVFYQVRTLLRTDIEDDILDVQVVSVPPSPGDDTFKFRFDWHYICNKINSFDHEALRQRLGEAHTYVLRIFEASFKEPAWSLFQPEESE